MIDDNIQQRWDLAASSRKDQLELAGIWFKRLLALMSDLHGEDGCPWDREQTLASLRQYIREEADEVCTAIDDILEFEDDVRKSAGLPGDNLKAPTTLDTARTPKKGKTIANHPLHDGFAPRTSASGAPLPAEVPSTEYELRERLYLKLHNEIGDLLMQPVFLCEILTRMGHGGIERSAQEVVEKLIRRHPHVYGDATATDSAQVLHNWEAIKRAEQEPESDS